MKATKTSALSLLLAILLILSQLTVLTSCGNADEPGSESGEDTAQESETTAYDRLNKTTWGGRTFSILGREDYYSNFYVEEYGVDSNTLLDNCIYERNTVVSRDLDIVFDVINGGSFEQVNNTVITQATTGTDDYDVMVGHKYSFNSCALPGYLINLADVPQIDLTSPWWDQSCVQNLTVNNRIMLVCGDALPGSMMMTACFAFNKTLMGNLNKELPYDAVRQGKWTMDMLNEMSAGVTTDLNGDGAFKLEDDLFGITAWMMGYPFNLFYAAGDPLISFTEDGLPEMNLNKDKMIAIYDKIYQSVYTQNGYYCTNADIYPQSLDMFTQGRTLFIDLSLANLDAYSQQMEDDFGILPQPKFDEAQDHYYAFVNGHAPFLGVITSEQTTDFSGAVMDAMGAYNYSSVSPLMFEIVTKYRTARDPESAEMVDIIIRHRVFDFAYFFDLSISNVILVSLNEGSKSLGSSLASGEKNTKNELKKLIKAFGN